MHFSDLELNNCASLNKISCSKAVSSSFATGFKLSSFITFPFGLPKWDNKTIFEFLFINWFIVGIIASNLVKSVNSPALWGRFKSTLTKQILLLINSKKETYIPHRYNPTRN